MPNGTVSKLRVSRARTELALREFKHFLSLTTTLDEAVKRKSKWPTHLEYLNVVADRLQYNESRTLWIPKSRRMMATWTVTAFALWEALRQDNFLGLIQSQTEEHSKDLLEDRIKLMYEALPRWFRFYAVRNEPDWTRLDVRFRDKDSRIKVFPQGARQARQYTPTQIIVDEGAHQDQFEDTLTAMIPFLEKDTRAIFLSSIAPSYFADACYSEPATDPVTLYPGNESLPPERRRGVRTWELKHGGSVLEIHYSADPTKDYEWLMRMDKEVEGGIDGPKWMQEMELHKDAFSGQRVYAHFNEHTHVKAFDVPVRATRWLSADYGLRAETAALAVARLSETPQGPVYGVYDEYYQGGLSIEDIKVAFKTHFGPSEVFETEWIDPTTDWLREKDTKTHFKLFNDGPNARSFQKADNSRDGVVLISEWLHQGRLLIHPRCKHLIHEMKHYRYEEWATDTQKKAHDPKEKVVKKEDHACDALKYFANGVRYDELPEEQEDEILSAIQTILENLESNRLEDIHAW